MGVPRGFLYKVVKVSLAEQATLRMGTDGKGRIVRRNDSSTGDGMV